MLRFWCAAVCVCCWLHAAKLVCVYGWLMCGVWVWSGGEGRQGWEGAELYLGPAYVHLVWPCFRLDSLAVRSNIRERWHRSMSATCMRVTVILWATSIHNAWRCARMAQRLHVASSRMVQPQPPATLPSPWACMVAPSLAGRWAWVSF